MHGDKGCWGGGNDDNGIHVAYKEPRVSWGIEGENVVTYELSWLGTWDLSTYVKVEEYDFVLCETYRESRALRRVHLYQCP